MKRLLLIAAILFCSPAWSFSEDAPAKSSESAAEALKASPNDPLAWRKYMVEQFSQLVPLIQSNPEEADKKIKEINKFLDELQPTEDVGKNQVTAVRQAVKRYEDLIAANRMTMEELGQKLKESPDDLKLIQTLMMKATSVMTMARAKPEEAEKTLAEIKKLASAAGEAATSEIGKKQYENLDRLFTTIERTLSASKKLAELIGKDAAPLKVSDWVNGEPLKDDDLKGKVVLLDFWAVWCGPCIATFPHLREWNEKYEKKGLVMIGLTRYYNWEWDETAGRPKQVKDPVPHDKELEMLKKFAEHHKLTHRFALQEDDSLGEYYGVAGIPHVVVIDRKGKVRLMKVGSGEANAKAIGEMLEKLLADEVAAN